MQSCRTLTPCQSDTGDDEWAFVAPYLSLPPDSAVQRRHDLRRVFDALQRIAWTGAPWRALPHDFPPRRIVHQQAMRRLAAGVFEAMVHDLRVLRRAFAGRRKRPAAAILDSRTRQSTPESGHRAGDDGARRRKGSKLHPAVDTPGHPPAAHGIRLIVVKHPQARRGFVLPPRRWAAERSFPWTARFRRLARDDERLPPVLAGFRFIAFACLRVKNATPLLASAA